MKLELFVAGCPLCSETESMVRRVIGPQCTVEVLNLAKGRGRARAKKYGIRAVPTIVGNGRKMFEGVPQYKELLKCSAQHGCKGRLL